MGVEIDTGSTAQAMWLVDPTTKLPFNGFPVFSANPATIYTAQQKTTASPAALAAKALVNGVVLTARSTNAAPVVVGFDNTLTTATDGTGSGYPLLPGQSISFGVTNANAIFIIGGNTTDVLYIAGN